MKHILIVLAITASASCQIYTQIQEDGYHYDRPNIDVRLNLPSNVPKTPAAPKVIPAKPSLPVKPNVVQRVEPAVPNLPPIPSFLPQINLPKVIPVKPAAQPLPVKPAVKNLPVKPVISELPPIPSFLPQINLPKVIPVKPSLPVKPDVTARVDNEVPALPPIPSFLPQINLPKVIPVKPASQPLPVKPDVTARVENEVPALPPIPSFLPQINLPKVIPIKPASQPLPVKPDVKKPAPFTAPNIDVRGLNDYLPPVTNDYLPPLSDQILQPSEDLTVWADWKKKFSKRYATAEEDHYRQTIFEDNVNFILSQNEAYESGKTSSDCSVNKFADLTTEEFISFYTGIRLKGRSAEQSPTRFYDAPYGKSNVAIDASGIDITSSGFASLSGSSGLFGNARGSFSSGSGSFGSQNATSRSGFASGSGSSSSQSSDGTDQGQQKMNIFMASPMLEKEVKDEVDWRKEGAITPVKNQGKCASCWAFSSNGALEAHNFLRKKTGPIPLSEQNLIDCVKENDGCDGGYMTNAYIYAERNPGVDTESTYPYEAKQSKCRFSRANVGGECMTHMEIQIGNEKALEQAVAAVGPVSAGIDGGQRSFQFYKSGYYYEPKCEDDVNHAVLIVGYGKTESGEEYWICKNSWDTDWGEEGYIRMAKNKNNNCGITNLASYPIV